MGKICLDLHETKIDKTWSRRYLSNWLETHEKSIRKTPKTYLESSCACIYKPCFGHENQHFRENTLSLQALLRDIGSSLF
jgi:hypothetical protein